MSNSKSDYQGFPSEFVPPNVKEKPEYILKYLRAMYEVKRRNAGYYTRENNRIIVNRKYADGSQSIQKYKSTFGVEEGDTSLMNLDFSALGIMSKFVELLIGEYINQESKVVAEAIDPQSKASKDKQRDRYLANMELKRFHDEISQLSDNTISVIPKGEYVPEDEQELDLHMQLNFKQATEIAIEEICDYVFNNNKWDAKLKQRIYRDLIVIKRAAFKMYFDENFKIKIDYVDWANIIVPFGVRDDLSEARYVGEVKKIPIHELRRNAKGDLTEEDLWKIAKGSVGANGNTNNWGYGTSFHNYYDQTGSDGKGGYDDFLIEVLDAHFISLNIKKYEERENAYDGFSFGEKPYNYKERKSEKRKLTEKEIDQVYKGVWIIGTDYVYGAGLAENTIRPKVNGKASGTPLLPYVMLMPDQYDMESKSLAEKMMPHEDGANLAKLKIQHLLAKLTPPGLAINTDALKDVFLGSGKAVSPLKIQEIYQALGTYYYSGTDAGGNPYSIPPISELNNSMGPALQELIQLYNHHIQCMRDVTGLNEVRDASSPDKDMLVGTQKLMLGSSRNTTRSLDHGAETMFLEAAERVSMMVQQNLQFNRNEDAYRNIIGAEKVKTLDFGKDFDIAEFGIKLQSKPTEEERADLKNKLAISLQAGELRIEDSIMIEEIPNVKLAFQYLILRRKKYAEERAKEAEVNAQINAQIQQQSLQEKGQLDAQKIQLETQSKSQLLQLEYQLKMELERVKQSGGQENKALEGEYKSRHIKEASEENFKNTALSKTQPQERVFTGGS